MAGSMPRGVEALSRRPGPRCLLVLESRRKGLRSKRTAWGPHRRATGDPFQHSPSSDGQGKGGTLG